MRANGDELRAIPYDSLAVSVEIERELADSSSRMLSDTSEVKVANKVMK